MCDEKNLPQEGKVTPSDLFRENWAHVRHVETERLGFTSVYIVIVAGVLAFLGQKGLENEFSHYLVWLLIVLSGVGALISARLRADMNAHGGKLKSLAEASGLSDYFTFGDESGWTKYIKLRTLFPLLYLMCTLFFLYFVFCMPNPSLLRANADKTAGNRELNSAFSGTPKEAEMHANFSDQRGGQKASANKSIKAATK